MARRQRGYFDRDSGYEDNPVTMLVMLGLPALIAATGGILLLTRKKPAPPIKKTEVLPSIPPPAKGTYRAEIAWVELQDWQERWFKGQGVGMEAADIEAVIAHFVSTGKVPTESEVMAYLTGLGFNYTATIVQQIIQQVTERLNPNNRTLPEPSLDEINQCVDWHVENRISPTLDSVTGYFSIYRISWVSGTGVPGRNEYGRNVSQKTLAYIQARYNERVNEGRFPTKADIQEAIAHFCSVGIIAREGAESEAISNWFKKRGLNPRDSDIQQVIVGRKNCAQLPPPDPWPVPPVVEIGTCVLTSGFQAGPPPTDKAWCEAVGGVWFPGGGKKYTPRQIGPPISVPKGSPVPPDVAPKPGYPNGTTKTGTLTKGTPNTAGVFTSGQTTKTFQM